MLREGDQRVIREVIPVVIRGVFTRAGEHDRAEELLVITMKVNSANHSAPEHVNMTAPRSSS